MPKIKNASMELIAERMNVSVATVSRALNCRDKGIRRVASRRAQKIRALAHKLGYRPSAAPRAMISKRYNTVAILRPTDYRRGHLPMHRLRGLEEALAERSLQLMLARVDDSRLNDDAYMQSFLARWFVDGFLMDFEAGYSPSLVNLLGRYRLPTVWLNVKHKFDCVHPDDYQGGRTATEYLLKLGHKRIALWTFPPRPDTWPEQHYSAYDRRAGYLDAMRNAGRPPYLIHEWMEYSERVPFLLTKLQQPDAPTAWITTNLTEATALMTAAGRLGMSIPQAFSMLTFFNDWTMTDAMRLTYIEIPEYDVGRKAVDMLVGKMDSPHMHFPEISVPMRLVEQDTCRAL